MNLFYDKDGDRYVISARTVHFALKRWGRDVAASEVQPEAFGWLDCSPMVKVLKDPGRCTNVVLIGSEAAVAHLNMAQSQVMLLNVLVRALPFKMFQPVEMHYVRELNNEDVGLQIGLSEDQVRGRLKKAKAQLVTQVRALRPDWEEPLYRSAA